MWCQPGVCGRSKYCNICIIPSQKRRPVHFLFLNVKCDFSCTFWKSAFCNSCIGPSQKKGHIHFLFLIVRVKCVGEASIAIAVSSPHGKEALSTLLLTVCVKCDFSVVPVGEASIVIAVSSPHRKEALEAVHFAIDHVKATVPVWKKVSLLLPLLFFFFLQNLYAEIIIIVMMCVCALYTYGLLSFRLICVMWALSIDEHILNVHY